MKNPVTFWLAIFSVIVIVVLIGGSILRPGNHVDWEIPSHARIRNAGAIGVALSKYQFNHNGHLPNQLSELVPQYIHPEDIRFFFPPVHDNVSNPASSLSTNLSGEIDENGAFCYLGERGIQQDLVLYERTNFWPLNLDATNVMIITSNFTTKFRSGKDVAAKLSLLK